MKILVTGLLPYESGKTEFVLGLVNSLQNLGFKPGYFKPVAGHNGWYQYDTLIHSIELGLLIGHDAYVVADKLGLKDIIQVMSPLDILTLPIDPFGKIPSIRSYLEYMNTTSKITVLVRFTSNMSINNELRSQHTYIVCKDTLEKLPASLRDVFNELMKSIRKRNVLFIDANTLFVERFLENPRIYDAIDENIKYLERFDPLIIESYNDAAAPTRASLNADYVFIVAPGKALLYNGKRYRDAVLVSAYSGYPWSIRSSTIFEILGQPLKAYDLPIKLYGDKYTSLFDEIVGFITRD